MTERREFTPASAPDVVPHKPEPTPWHYEDGGWTKVRYLNCRFCGVPVQRQGFLRRWKHVA